MKHSPSNCNSNATTSAVENKTSCMQSLLYSVILSESA